MRSVTPAAHLLGAASPEDVGKIYAKPVVPRLAVVMRDGNWRRQCAEHGMHNDTMVGVAMGVSPSTIWRIRRRLASPGIGFVLQAMRVFGASFEELFEVLAVAEEPERQAAQQETAA